MNNKREIRKERGDTQFYRDSKKNKEKKTRTKSKAMLFTETVQRADR